MGEGPGVRVFNPTLLPDMRGIIHQKFTPAFFAFYLLGDLDFVVEGFAIGASPFIARGDEFNRIEFITFYWFLVSLFTCLLPSPKPQLLGGLVGAFLAAAFLLAQQFIPEALVVATRADG